MTIPSIGNPYRTLAAYALRKQPDVIPEVAILEAEKRAKQVCGSDPPLLQKFLSFYTDVEPHLQVTSEDTDQVEKLLRCIWRGETEEGWSPTPGSYQHQGNSLHCSYSSRSVKLTQR